MKKGGNGESVTKDGEENRRKRLKWGRERQNTEVEGGRKFI